ncbi:hypothetical protein [Mycolicibacterium sp. HK-90]|uniref:hypothetical protein n=1 Tax=Mycolicibacterium sp. HK-90 TaxID=3056937 RepID=UPI002658BE7F|nr:hypothetical protein [Mycolicibacterium sp. HK-90]WKG03058.1 hypothetical protein QU592_28380 [Mycolicibacterium sp. HK-90]
MTLVPEGNVLKSKLWVSPTRAANLDGLSGEAVQAARARYDGIEVAIEAWDGSKHRPAKLLRMRADDARTLAAVLVQAADIADIQQGHNTP